jgi:tetratricopeptide (TPR) repeat protein
MGRKESDLQKAEMFYLKAHELNPNHLDVMYYLFALYGRSTPVNFIKRHSLLKKIEKIVRTETDIYMINVRWAMHYGGLGDFDKESFHVAIMDSIDPNSSNVVPALRLLLSGNADLAIEEVEKRFPAENQTRNVLLGQYHYYAGKYEAAKTYFQKWEELVLDEGNDTFASISEWHRYGQVLFILGEEDRGKEYMMRQIRTNKRRIERGSVNALYELSGIYSFLNMKDSSFYYLDLLADNPLAIGFNWMIRDAKIDPQFDNIRSDQKFKDFIQSLEDKKAAIREEIYQLEAEGKL